MSSPKPFSGTKRSLVLAFDFGTTFSGVAYAILDPDQVPKIQSVTRFPGQENSDFKIPSLMCYTKDGTLCAAGAEAREVNMEPDINDGTLVFVEWFKLYLCPLSMRPKGLTIPQLPPGKTAVGVIADFLAYLLECAKNYIHQTQANGESIWNSVQGHIDVVLSHPNGWEVSQHVKMREAAVLAKLIPSGPAGRTKLHFVTEGEASLHYCVNSGLASDAIKDGSRVMIIDCGGGTVDLTTYKFVTAEPIQVEEIASPACILQGSTRINMRFKTFLLDKLKDSRFCRTEEIDAMMERFERSTKPRFNDPSVRLFVKFGGLRDSDSKAGIVRGSLSVDGKDMESFFEPTIVAITEAITNQMLKASTPVQTAFLVGGFAASTWLYTRLKDNIKSDIDLCRPDSHTSKAVSEGAVLYFLMKSVIARVSRLTYGVCHRRLFRPNDPEHQKRSNRVYTSLSGHQMVPEGFQAFVLRGKRLVANDEIRHSYVENRSRREELDTIRVDIKCYHGVADTPRWTDEDALSYTSMCTIYADTSSVFKERLIGPSGPYFSQEYDVVLKVGLTEFQAYIAWRENGDERWSPAEIIPVDD